MARIEESKRTYIEELATNPRVNLMVYRNESILCFMKTKVKYLWQRR